MQGSRALCVHSVLHLYPLLYALRPQIKSCSAADPLALSLAHLDSHLPRRKKEALQEKELGNDAYKKKDFERAIQHYNRCAIHVVGSTATQVWVQLQPRFGFTATQGPAAALSRCKKARFERATQHYNR